VNASREGFSLIEVVVSMIILTVGVLAMGASTGYVLSQVRHSGLTMERNVAVREVSEQLRATDWSAIESECNSNTFVVGDFTVTCSAQVPQKHLKAVRLISVGPSYVVGGGVETVADTTAILLAEPMS
jgi:prepilin-type N-terminal cleavage/methylation domain-containing protein